MAKVQIYLLPGLGGDKRMYLRQLNAIPEAIVIEHLPPVKNETLSEYANRMAKLIDSSSPFVLVGTSLGGMVSMEIARIIQPEKIILIASVKSRNEMPLFIRAMKYLNFHKLFSGRHFKQLNSVLVYFLDNKKHSEAAELIKGMANDTPDEFIEWAVDAVIKWNPAHKYPGEIVHIHGTGDMLFPISKVKDAIAIKNGTHIMNMTMSEEVNKILKEALQL